MPSARFLALSMAMIGKISLNSCRLLWIFVADKIHLTMTKMLIMLNMLVNLFFTGVTLSVPATVIVYERDEIVEVCATLSAVEETGRNFNFALATSDGTGQSAGENYIVINIAKEIL